MKKIVIIFLIIMLSKITSFSQTISTNINQDTIVSITSEQLKYANLIFAEHEKLSVENELLLNQIDNYKQKVSVLEQNDSLRIAQINNYQSLNEEYSNKINGLNETIRKKNKSIAWLKFGGITISCGLLILLLVK